MKIQAGAYAYNVGKQSRYQAALELGNQSQRDALIDVTNEIEQGNITDPNLTSHINDTNNPHSTKHYHIDSGTAPITKTNADSPYTAVTTDRTILVDTSSGAVTIALYAISGNAGRRLHIVKTTDDANTVTIDPNGAETINGDSSLILEAVDDAAHIEANATEWRIL